MTAGLVDEAEAASREAIELLGGDRPGPMTRSWALHHANLAEELCESGEWDEALDVRGTLPRRGGGPDWIGRRCRGPAS